ncbi:MAG: aromatic ring-hydroxylating dioxygenase subunit alpha, partial [Congregibacter sp.]|nr:aromatic ring-hydroxylating dioxygenase subunit alpha [Congregibacter sp.]
MNAPETIPVAIINPDAPDDSLEAKQAPVDNGTRNHGKAGYFSRDYMDLEWQKLWTRSWLIAGVTADLPKVNDYFLFDICGESIIVTRTEEGVRAFY